MTRAEARLKHFDMLDHLAKLQAIHRLAQSGLTPMDIAGLLRVHPELVKRVMAARVNVEPNTAI